MNHHEIPPVVVFDVYDTLVGWRHTVEEMAAKIGRTATDVFHGSMDLIKLTDEGLLSFAEYGHEMAERWGMPDYAVRVTEGFQPIEEMHRLATDFHDRGSRLVLATNAGRGVVRSCFTQKALPSIMRFEHVIESCKLGIAKPEGSFFRHILRRTGVAPAEHLFLDDNPANVEAAIEIGMQGVVVDINDYRRTADDVRALYLPDTLTA